MFDNTLLWLGFLAFVALILFVDLFLIHRKDRVIQLREALVISAGYIGIALGFAAGVFWFGGVEKGSEFLTAYLIEKALSMDNIFVIALIFTVFKVPHEARYRVLFYGIVGAILMRLTLILPGVVLVERFWFIATLLGAVLLYSGYKMATSGPDSIDPEQSWVVRRLRATGRVTEGYVGRRFFLRRDGVLYMTPLFIVLVTVEVTDLVFAVDSIPAVLAISRDPFIAFSSNVFAILGLRALFFVLAGMMARFHFLKLALSLVLVFIGAKMLIAHWYHLPSTLALGVTGGLIGGAVLLSLLFPQPSEEPLDQENR